MTAEREDPIPRGRVFRLPERLAELGPDPWIEDDEGERCFRVDETALARLDTFILRDLHGNEVAKLTQRDLRGEDATDIRREGTTLATVRRVRAGLRHRFFVELQDGMKLEVNGHVGRYDYEIRREQNVVATVSKKWFRGPQTYGVEIGAREDEAIVLAAAVAIEAMDRG